VIATSFCILNSCLFKTFGNIDNVFFYALLSSRIIFNEQGIVTQHDPTNEQEGLHKNAPVYGGRRQTDNDSCNHDQGGLMNEYESQFNGVVESVATSTTAEDESHADHDQDFIMDQYKQIGLIRARKWKEDFCADTKERVDRMYKSKFAHTIKFFQESDNDFLNPDFVTGMVGEKERKSQAVKICSYLMNGLDRSKKDPVSMCLFWNSYAKIIRKKHKDLRRYTVYAVGTRVITCKCFIFIFPTFYHDLLM
jgi:hypothetical protein